MYFTEGAAGAEEPAELPVEPILAEDQGTVPDYLCCMFPAEGMLTPDEISQMEALVMEYTCRDIFLGPDDSPGFPDLLTHKIGTGDAKPIKHNYYRRSIKGTGVYGRGVGEDVGEME